MFVIFKTSNKDFVSTISPFLMMTNIYNLFWFWFEFFWKFVKNSPSILATKILCHFESISRICLWQLSLIILSKNSPSIHAFKIHMQNENININNIFINQKDHYKVSNLAFLNIKKHCSYAHILAAIWSSINHDQHT